MHNDVAVGWGENIFLPVLLKGALRPVGGRGFIGPRGITASFASLDDETLSSFTQCELISVIIVLWAYSNGRCFDISHFPVRLWGG